MSGQQPVRIGIRVDASLRIGTGHVMRCLALAEELRTRGAEVHFVCRDHAGSMADAVRESGHVLHLLPRPAGAGSAGNGTAHADWLGIDAAADADETRLALEPLGPIDWLVVDHYALDRSWMQRQRAAVRNILVIDDLADRAHDCDLLLDPAPVAVGEDRYAGLLPEGCGRLFGPAYALLRGEFLRHRAAAIPRTGEVRRLFVSFGGVDAPGLTEKAMVIAPQLAARGIHIDIVVGRGNPRVAALRQAAAAIRNLSFHHGVSNVAELMTTADLAVGAGGVMSWERACLGLPALVLIGAENQLPAARALEAAGCIETCAGPATSTSTLLARIRSLIERPADLRAMSLRCLALVDGRGAARVARLTQPPAVGLRRATAADSAAVFVWRNDPGIRRYFTNPAPITRAEHGRWFERVLADPDRALLIAECSGEPVGVLRYDVAGAVAVVSVYLAPGQAGRGFGPPVLRAGSAWLKAAHPAVREITAVVHPENERSHRAFRAAGYAPRSGGYGMRVRA